MFMFASTFVSHFNIVSMVMLTLMQKMGTEPILCIHILLSFLQLFSKMQTLAFAQSVNVPLFHSILRLPDF